MSAAVIHDHPPSTHGSSQRPQLGNVRAAAGIASSLTEALRDEPPPAFA
jgi:hypothetical protein